MYYYAVRFEGETHITGPHLAWQDACMARYGTIREDMAVKKLTNDGWLMRKSSWLDRELMETVGWFHPWIPTSELGLTVVPSMALGPPEIGDYLLKLSEQLRSCKDRAGVLSVNEAAIDYLRQSNVKVCAKWADLYDYYLGLFPVLEIL